MIEIQIPLWLVIILLAVLAGSLVWLIMMVIFGWKSNDDSLTNDDYENSSK